VIETRHSDFGRSFFLVLLGIGWLSTGALAPGDDSEPDTPRQSTYSEWGSPLWTVGFQRSATLDAGERDLGGTDPGPVQASGRAASILPAAIARSPLRATTGGLGNLNAPARAPPS